MTTDQKSLPDNINELPLFKESNRKKEMQQKKKPQEHEKCIACNLTRFPIVEDGLCSKCYYRIFKKSNRIEEPQQKKWSKHYEQCISCQATDFPHVNNGICSRCYYLKKIKKREIEQQIDLSIKDLSIQQRKSQKTSSKIKQWSQKYAFCIKCGDNQTRHVARGLCLECYEKESYNRHSGGHNYRPIQAKLTYQYIFEEYVNKKRSLADIAKDCKCTRQNIYKKIKLWDIPTRDKREARTLAHDRGKIIFKREDEHGNVTELITQKTIVNERFFSEWSNEMAYVLGVIYTDGSLDPGSKLDPTRKTTLKVARLSMSQKEPELLEKVLRLMESNSRLMVRKRAVYNKVVSGKTYIFYIHNEKIYDDLTRLGLTPNKSKTITFPEIPEQYMRHFIRGCWDGDGSVFLNRWEYKNTKPKIGASFVSGSKSFVESMAQALEKAGLPKRDIKRDRASYMIRYHTNQCRLLYQYLYHDVPPEQYLERKYKVFERYFGELTTD